MQNSREGDWLRSMDRPISAKDPLAYFFTSVTSGPMTIVSAAFLSQPLSGILAGWARLR